MARKKSKTLTELELEIMRVVWDRGQAKVDDIRGALAQAGKALALPSIRTMLGILARKGYVTRRPAAGRGFVYRAKISRDGATKTIVKDVVDRAFDGSALDLVAALIDTRMVGRKELAQVKRLIRRREREEGK